MKLQEALESTKVARLCVTGRWLAKQEPGTEQEFIKALESYTPNRLHTAAVKMGYPGQAEAFRKHFALDCMCKK